MIDSTASSRTTSAGVPLSIRFKIEAGGMGLVRLRVNSDPVCGAYEMVGRSLKVLVPAHTEAKDIGR